MTNRKVETKGWCYIACEVKRKTASAVLIHDGTRDAWIPNSQIEDPDPADLDVGQHVDLLLPEWIAREKGLV